MVKYILASNSPRRRELLEQAGICFEISPAQGEEISTGDLPADIVEELSCKKAAEVAQRYLQKYENDTVVIIGADTVVACQGEIMGKPRDQADASAMLAKLQGGMHQVYTGVTFIVLERGQGERGQKAVTFHERTDVSMYREQIAAYVATGEPMDKAGAYAIQGKCAVHIKGINGDYNNVVGLPVARLVHELFEIHLA